MSNRRIEQTTQPRAAAPVLIPASDATAAAVAFLAAQGYYVLDAGNDWFMVLPPGYGSQGELFLGGQVRALAADEGWQGVSHT